MRATFYGFEASRKALMAAQTAMDITNQNVTNVNTSGYTRQRVDLSSIGVTTTSRFGTSASANVGLGVNIDGITQIRDSFLDIQFRKESAENGKWEARLDVLKDVEDIIDEFDTDGLNNKLGELYKQLKSFSENCDSIEYATVFRSSAQKVTETINQYSVMLDKISEEYKYNTDTELTAVNNKLVKVAALNTLIKGQIVQGVQPNELLDSRNLILDQIANITGAEFKFDPSGQVSIKIGDTYLLDSDNNNAITNLQTTETASGFKITTTEGVDVNITSGSAKGYLEGLNGMGNFADESLGQVSIKGLKYFQMSIDSLAQSFAETLNSINDPTGTKKLFVGDEDGVINASSIKLSEDWLEDADFITKTTQPPIDGTSSTGRNDNLLRMIAAMDDKRNITSHFKGTFEEYITSIIGDLAVEVDYVTDMADASDTNLNSISEQRESVMGVNLDEETINLVKFQKAYNAAARVMTAMDQMLDTLINNTGMVGR